MTSERFSKHGFAKAYLFQVSILKPMFSIGKCQKTGHYWGGPRDHLIQPQEVINRDLSITG